MRLTVYLKKKKKLIATPGSFISEGILNVTLLEILVILEFEDFFLIYGSSANEAEMTTVITY